MMRCAMPLALLLVFTALSAFAEDALIKAGQDIDVVSDLMKKAGYKDGFLEMAPAKGSDIKMWAVGQGTLILTFAVADKKVISIAYHLNDERPKSKQKTFDFSVIEFNPSNRAMKITVSE